MPLFNDGPINTEQDLQNYETAVLDVAGVEEIDLGTKIALAQDEIGTDLLAFLLRRGTGNAQPGWIGQSSMLRRKIGTGDIVVTPPLKRSHALLTMARVYRDAYSNQLNDRYKGKWQAYEQDAEVAGIKYLQIGVGLALDPVSKPGAPSLTITPGSGTATTFFVSVTWLNAEGQEGTPSDATSLDIGDGVQLVVTAPAAPANARAWNVYAGDTPDTALLQNSVPIAIGQTWMQPAGVAQGAPAGTGQTPDRYIVNDRLMQRG